MAYVSISDRGMITAISEKYFDDTVEIPGPADKSLLGKRMIHKTDKLRVAVICNWGQNCGISTYAKYLVDSLRPRVSELKIFSEHGVEASEVVEPCWRRGESMHEAIKKVQEWKPDFVLIQHEFGIFPKAPYLLQMLQMLDDIPYAVVLHSTYEHLDKSVCTSAMKRLIVHTDVAKGILRKLGNLGDIHVIPHGCVQFPDRDRLWNIYQTEHVIVQFGFGFFYKGVDRAIDAIKILKDSYPDKYDGEKDKIFYCYYCSESGHCKNIHNEYMSYLMKKVEGLGLRDNVVVIKKYNSDQEVNNILRTAKMAIFPYLINKDNMVYGASGAIRVAMANGLPVLASESHLFDELPVPRPDSAQALSDEIHRIFSDCSHKERLVAAQDDYVLDNNWGSVADRYVETMNQIRNENNYVLE